MLRRSASIVSVLLVMASLLAPQVASAQALTVPGLNPSLDRKLLTVRPSRPRIVVVIDGATSLATVSLYDGEKLVGTMRGFGGVQGDPARRSLTGSVKIIAHLGTVHTGIYRHKLGHEYYLPYFMQLKGNYGFHAYPVNDRTRKAEPGPTYGCVALPEEDAEALYQWARNGTAVQIAYTGAAAHAAAKR